MPAPADSMDAGTASQLIPGVRRTFALASVDAEVGEMVVLRIVILAGFLIAVAACGIWSTVLLQIIVEEVNQRTPDGQRVLPYGWYGMKYRQVIREYRRQLPTGGLDRQLRILVHVMVLSTAGMAFTIGFGVAASLYLAVGGSLIAWFLHRP